MIMKSDILFIQFLKKGKVSRMLALSRKKDEAIIINDDVEVTVIEIKGDQVKLGITAPKSVPIYRKEVYVQIKDANPLYKNDILMVMSDLPNGRALAKCYLVEENDKYTLNQRIGAFTVNRTHLISTKYLYYVLNRNRQLLRYDNGADQTNLRKNDILNISIAIPTIEEQQKITDILDRFDSICNDLSIGLPAEIEARKKQYEYYRDKLLTFKELQK